METPKQKIIKYLKHKEISQDKFARDCEVSGAFLRQGKSFSIEMLPKIRNNYKDLNLNWLIYDEGTMLLSSDNSFAEEKSDYKKTFETIEILKERLEAANNLLVAKNETIKAKDETITFLKQQLKILPNKESKAS